MPVVLRVNGYKFFFYEADLVNEPPHVHITKDGNEAKFWLNIKDNHDFLLSAWEKEKSKHVHG